MRLCRFFWKIRIKRKGDSPNFATGKKRRENSDPYRERSSSRGWHGLSWQARTTRKPQKSQAHLLVATEVRLLRILAAQLVQ